MLIRHSLEYVAGINMKYVRILCVGYLSMFLFGCVYHAKGYKNNESDSLDYGWVVAASFGNGNYWWIDSAKQLVPNIRLSLYPEGMDFEHPQDYSKNQSLYGCRLSEFQLTHPNGSLVYSWVNFDSTVVLPSAKVAVSSNYRHSKRRADVKEEHAQLQVMPDSLLLALTVEFIDTANQVSVKHGYSIILYPYSRWFFVPFVEP